MAIVGTGALKRALWPGVNKWCGDAYERKAHQYKEIFDIRKSDKNYEVDVTLGPTGLLAVKPEGAAFSYDDFAQGFTQEYRHLVYANGFILTREHIEDNQYMELAEARAKMLGDSAKETKETVAAAVLNQAFDSTRTYADGLELCSLVHKLEKGGTYKNELTTAADLSEASLEQMVIDIADLRDGANKRINARAKKLIVPRALVFDAHRILKSALQNDTANNAVNALKNMGLFEDGVCVNDYLTDTDAFFVKTSVPNALVMMERRALELSNDEDFDSENMKFKVTERYAVGSTDPRGIFGSPGAA